MTLLGKRMATHAGLTALLMIALGIPPAFAQGTQTGVITGLVSSTDGAPLPGVAVTITSPAMQGGRTTTTDSSGAYLVRGLPPGEYRVAFALSGFGNVERNVAVALGG